LKLQYHQKSFNLIRGVAEFTDKVFANLPASVAEWYSLVNGKTLLEKYSNQDVPLAPAEFEISVFGNSELIVFMYENQGVYWWAFENCDNGDPPVYINVDPPTDNWIICCDTFSAFVYTRFFDYFHWHDEKLIVMGGGNPLNPNILETLRNEFSPEPVTYGRSGFTQFRFSHDDVKITIHDDGSQSDWFFSADSQGALGKVLEQFKLSLEWYIPTKIGNE